MSLFTDTQAALDKLKCANCGGLGDADHMTAPCAICKGSGFTTYKTLSNDQYQAFSDTQRCLWKGVLDIELRKPDDELDQLGPSSM